MAQETKLPTRGKKRQDYSIKVRKLQGAIDEAINKVCEEYDYNITYNQIHSALARVLSTSTVQEVSLTWEEESENED